jgi:hypothetical protein
VHPPFVVTSIALDNGNRSERALKTGVDHARSLGVAEVKPFSVAPLVEAPSRPRKRPSICQCSRETRAPRVRSSKPDSIGQARASLHELPRWLDSITGVGTSSLTPRDRTRPADEICRGVSPQL